MLAGRSIGPVVGILTMTGKEGTCETAIKVEFGIPSIGNIYLKIMLRKPHMLS